MVDLLVRVADSNYEAAEAEKDVETGIGDAKDEREADIVQVITVVESQIEDETVISTLVLQNSHHSQPDRAAKRRLSAWA